MKYISIAILVILGLALDSCTDNAKLIRQEINAGIKDNSQSNFDGALVHFQNVLDIDNTNSEVYLYMGNAYFNKKEYTLSMESANKAIEYNSSYGEAYLLREKKKKKILNDNDKACENYLLAEKYGIKNLYNYTKFCK